MRLALALLAVSSCGCLPTVYDQPYPVAPVELPRDEAAHEAPIEWWYYTGHLWDEDGRQYGFELTFFKAYTPPQAQLFGFLPAVWLAEKGHVAHFALTDLGARRFEMAERADFWGYRAAASSESFDLTVADWYARAQPDGSYAVGASLGDKKLRLTLRPAKPAALHGEPPGIQAMGPGGVSYYLSYTRMEAEGVLLTDCGFFGCRERRVAGQAWHDHQWGDFRFDGYAGWDWFALQLGDNTELMLYLIRGPDGGYLARAGSFVTASGRTLPLDGDDFALEPTGETWTSPRTGAVYPLGWAVAAPRFGVEVTVAPLLNEQEMDTRASTGVVYWEGAVSVSGSHDGLGYVELTNYDRYPFGAPRGALLEPRFGPTVGPLSPP